VTCYEAARRWRPPGGEARAGWLAGFIRRSSEARAFHARAGWSAGFIRRSSEARTLYARAGWPAGFIRRSSEARAFHARAGWPAGFIRRSSEARALYARAGWRAGGRPAMKSPGYGAAGAQAPLESPVHRAQFRSTGISCPCGMASRIHPAQFRSTGTSCPCGVAGRRPPGDEVAGLRSSGRSSALGKPGSPGAVPKHGHFMPVRDG